MSVIEKMMCANCKAPQILEKTPLTVSGTETWKCSKCFMRVYVTVYEAECKEVLIKCATCDTWVKQGERFCNECTEFRMAALAQGIVAKEEEEEDEDDDQEGFRSLEGYKYVN